MTVDLDSDNDQAVKGHALADPLSSQNDDQPDRPRFEQGRLQLDRRDDSWIAAVEQEGSFWNRVVVTDEAGNERCLALPRWRLLADRGELGLDPL